jgi:hypothetical protein
VVTPGSPRPRIRKDQCLFNTLSDLSASGLVSLGIPRLEYRSQRHILQVGSSSTFECISPSRINERSMVTAGRWHAWHLTSDAFAEDCCFVLCGCGIGRGAVTGCGSLNI